MFGDLRLTSFAFVHLHVRFQLIRVAEFTIAHFANVGTFASVHPQMSPQISHLNELAITVRAVVGLLSCVQAHVGFQMVIACEPLVAFSAFEWFLTSMCAFVILQDMFVAEGTQTDFTRETLIACCYIPAGWVQCH